MPTPPRAVLVFVLVFVAALSFAFYTQHAWEDYWITFRSSRHFAEGHGLVFNRGDRLHTFTSPLGVLLPALAYLATFNSSDEAALWIFRVMSAAAFGGAVTLLYLAVRGPQARALTAFALVLFAGFDAKTVDFSINGMETGFLLLFLAWAFHALLVRRERQWLHLGLAWAGLMWSRPDSFIYIGALAAGVWLFNDRSRTGLGRAEWLSVFVRAGLVTTALYLPWLIGSWLYYGTPVPHTITAKGMSNAPVTLERFLSFLRALPAKTWAADNSFAAAFLPSYHIFGDWPAWIARAAALLSGAIAFVWALPAVRWWARAASFTFLVGHVYLSFIPYFPFPWYLPTTTFLASIVLVGLIQQAAEALGPDRGRRTRPLAWAFLGGVAAIAAVGVWLTVGTARQLSAAQRIVEDGNRKQIGLYLRENARPGDTVFMEPLGYIGYFSQLKTYDFPGLSSREMTEARKRVGNDWAWLINELRPDWLVLRSTEMRQLNRSDSSILGYRYREEKVFDVTAAIDRLDVPGRNYLRLDGHFTLLRNDPRPTFPTPYGPARGPFEGYNTMAMDGVEVVTLHAPCELLVDLPEGAREVHVRFGFLEGTYVTDEQKTDGARFSVQVHADDALTIIWQRELFPASEAADRGLLSATIALPADLTPSQLILRIDSGESMTRDWVAWAKPEFR